MFSNEYSGIINRSKKPMAFLYKGLGKKLCSPSTVFAEVRAKATK